MKLLQDNFKTCLCQIPSSLQIEIILRQFQNLSLPNFFISSTRNILRQFQNLSEPQILLSKSQLTCSQLARRMILLALAQISKDTWPSGYKCPVHKHNIQSLAIIHLLNSTRWNSSRPPPHFLTFLTWIFPYQSSTDKTQTITIHQHPPKEHELQPNSSTLMMVSVSSSFPSLAVYFSVEILSRFLHFKPS